MDKYLTLIDRLNKAVVSLYMVAESQTGPFPLKPEDFFSYQDVKLSEIGELQKEIRSKLWYLRETNGK